LLDDKLARVRSGNERQRSRPGRAEAEVGAAGGGAGKLKPHRNRVAGLELRRGIVAVNPFVIAVLVKAVITIVGGRAAAVRRYIVVADNVPRIGGLKAFNERAGRGADVEGGGRGPAQGAGSGGQCVTVACFVDRQIA